MKQGLFNAWFKFNAMVQSVRALYRRVWWFDILYPVALSGALLVGLTFLFYSGQRHRRIASDIEKTLITVSLRLAGPRAIQKPGNIVVVSLRPNDFPLVEQTTDNGYTDATIAAYSNLLRTILEKGATYIAIQWKPHHHANAEDYAPLLHVLATKGHDQQVFFGIYPNSVKSVPADVVKSLPFLDSDACQTGTQVLCIYDLQWTNWLLQAIPKHFWTRISAPDPQVSGFISTNLPEQHPAYILHLSAEGQFPHYSFAEILQSGPGELDLRGKSVFVGNDLIQGFAGSNRTFEPARVRTVFTSEHTSVREGGTPLHEFWAQLAQLFIDDDLVRVADYQTIVLMTVIVVMVVLLILFILGAHFALGVYLSFAAAMPVANAMLIHFANLYFPTFDALYAGLVAFLEATFIKLSLESFYHWRLAVRQETEAETLDIKGNFISLISHNLNTPVAKMQGMFTLVHQYAIDPVLKGKTETALFWVARIQLCTRSVLVTTAVNEGQLNHEPLTVQALLKEFSASFKSPLKRCGYSIEPVFAEMDPDLLSLPMRFDKRAVVSALGLLATLFSRSSAAETRLIVTFLVVEDDDGLVHLRCRVEGNPGAIAPSLVQQLLEPHTATTESGSLLEDVAIKLVHSVCNAYDGALTAERNSTGEFTTATFTLTPFRTRAQNLQG